MRHLVLVLILLLGVSSYANTLTFSGEVVEPSCSLNRMPNYSASLITVKLNRCDALIQKPRIKAIPPLTTPQSTQKINIQLLDTQGRSISTLSFRQYPQMAYVHYIVEYL